MLTVTGNDIVYLHDQQCISRYRDKRFLLKVFVKSELLQLEKSLNPDTDVWIRWSMKEAAYKGVAQLQSKTAFHPKKFITSVINKQPLVFYNDDCFYTTSIITNNYIHTIAYNKPEVKVTSNCFIYQSVNQNQQSLFVRNLLRKELSLSDDYVITKSFKGFPQIIYKNQILPISLSFSHHENCIGYSMVYH